MEDTIYRQDAIDAVKNYWKSEVDRIPKKSTDFDVFTQICDSILSHNANICKVIDKLPSAQPVVHGDRMSDCISRQAAIATAISGRVRTLPTTEDGENWIRVNEVRDSLLSLPSARPERTCVNCGRTVNNGGWYADGRTRCPIEEHYALPKDGYCHLWEKRNVTDDDYPERREE